jgi:hypothetical protein
MPEEERKFPLLAVSGDPNILRPTIKRIEDAMYAKFTNIPVSIIISS